jgi:hypothetical protein
VKHHGIRTIVSGKESIERDENLATRAEERACSQRFRTSLLPSLRLVRDNFLERSVTSRDFLPDGAC